MSYIPPNPNGQATSANSAPVVIASDQSAVPVTGTITASGDHTVVGKAADGTAATGNPVLVAGQDGSNNVQTMATDTNGNQSVVGSVASGSADSGNPVKIGGKYNATLPTVTDGQRVDAQFDSRGRQITVSTPANLEVAFSTTTVQAVATTDVSAYSWVSVHVVSQGTSSTITFQGSNDNTNWVSVALYRTDTTSGNTAGNNSLVTSITTAGQISTGPMPFRYFRLNVTGISAGTTSGVIEFSAQAKPPLQPTPTLTQVSTNAAPSDGISNGSATLAYSLSENLIFNGTTWDRMRGTGATGALNVGGDTAAAATDAGNPVKIGAKYNATKPTYTDGQRGDLQIGTRGSLHVSVMNQDGTSPTFPNSSGLVDGAGNPTTSIVGASGLVYNGSTWDRVRSDGTTGGQGVGGTVASGATDSGNPVKVGAVGRTTNPTAVTDGQRVNLTADKSGKLVTVGSIRELKGRQVTTITSSTAETTIVTAVASTFCDLYGLVLSNTSATATEVTIRDATGGGTVSSFMVPAGETRGFMLPESAAWPQATVNNNWTATCGSSVASLKVTALFIKNT